MTVPFKQCPTCHQWKMADQYHKNSQKPDGLHSQCKVCRKVFYDANSRRILDRNIEWNHKNRDRIREHNQRRVATIRGRARQLLKAAKNRAEERNLEFTITLELLEFHLAVGRCSRTGWDFDMSPQDKYKFNPRAPSLDKRNPFGGYTPDNVQVVCCCYNIGKGQSDDEQFLELCKRVVDNAK